QAAKDGVTPIRLLDTDERVVVPVATNVRLLVTAADVIHSWAMPAFGVKLDAVPGRVNETWFRAEREGVYYGQCSELCGVDHAFLPIAVEVVSKEAFDSWVRTAQENFDKIETPAAGSAAAPADAADGNQTAVELAGSAR